MSPVPVVPPAQRCAAKRLASPADVPRRGDLPRVAQPNSNSPANSAAADQLLTAALLRSLDPDRRPEESRHSTVAARRRRVVREAAPVRLAGQCAKIRRALKRTARSASERDHHHVPDVRRRRRCASNLPRAVFRWSTSCSTILPVLRLWSASNMPPSRRMRRRKQRTTSILVPHEPYNPHRAPGLRNGPRKDSSRFARVKRTGEKCRYPWGQLGNPLHPTDGLGILNSPCRRPA